MRANICRSMPSDIYILLHVVSLEIGMRFFWFLIQNLFGDVLRMCWRRSHVPTRTQEPFDGAVLRVRVLFFFPLKEQCLAATSQHANT